MLLAVYRAAQKIVTTGQWRRRLQCVVQQQGGHIEHFMQKLQDVKKVKGRAVPQRGLGGVLISLSRPLSP